MTFDEILARVLELLQRERRVAYRVLKRRFGLDDEYLEDLKADLIDAKRVATDEEGKVLVWVGDTTVVSSQLSVPSSSQPPAPQTSDSGLRTPDSASLPTLDARRDAAERRQLTVMFCDLVGFTALSEQLDPEELREVVRAYQQTSAAVIARYDGHIAQYLGDGVLVYFGYPTAHEDDAARAVRAGLEIIEALPQLNTQLATPLRVRVGIHTGAVVVGEIGGGAKREHLALGETPNIAARVQSQAEPDTVVMSVATYRLVQGLFECQGVGVPVLKGVTTPLALYRIVRESEARSRFEVAVNKGLMPLVGRDEELGLLRRRWEYAKEGTGQVVLLGGEAGIGKSRLVQALKEHVRAEGATHIEFRCSPYHQNSALYPIIEHLQRLLQFAREDAPAAKLEKLQHTLSHYRFPQADTVPLLAALLSLPHPEGYPPLAVSPQKQKEKTQAALVAWLVEEAERQPVYNTWEDVHWADPSTLEVLNLMVDQAPTACLFALLTFRPEFMPPWGNPSHISQMTLSRLGRPQVEAMVERVTGGKALPPEVVQQIVAKTDGVPLFVEELTKTVVESGLLTAVNDHYELSRPLPPLAIPATLQDSLMARLDRLAPVKEVAQLGAILGREFSYELIKAVSPLDEETLQRGLDQLVEAELVYQRGLPPQARYLFKHALIQDAAYHSLLKSKKQQYHLQVAQVLEGQFAETVETHPELVAHHYTEAGLIVQAIPYWQRAGEKATRRSANVEAIRHFTTALAALLKTLPDTVERAQQELALQTALGPVLIATKGWTAPEAGDAYNRARALCQRLGETPQSFPVLFGLWAFHLVRAEHETAHELAEQLLSLAQHQQDSALLIAARWALGLSLYHLGDAAASRTHLEQGLALYDPRQHRSLAFLYGQDLGMSCLCYIALDLGHLGYPDQALRHSQEGLARARESSHPFSLAWALNNLILFHLLRRERRIAQELNKEAIGLCTEQGFTLYVTTFTLFQGSLLAAQGQGEEGIAQIQQGLAAWRAAGADAYVPCWLAFLAEAYGQMEQAEEGLATLAEALTLVHKNRDEVWEAELYRLKGELTLQKEARGWRLETSSSPLQASSLKPQVSKEVEQEAEGYFLKAIDIARRQQAKLLELRATTSLSRLWLPQGKPAAARQLLAEVYGWFTEGFETSDLQEARALLGELTNTPSSPPEVSVTKGSPVQRRGQ